MKTILSLTMLITLFVSCKGEKDVEQAFVAKTVTANPAIKKRETFSSKKDSIIFERDSIIVNNNKFIISWSEDNAYIINSNQDTIYRFNDGGMYSPKFTDYNEDGYTDVIFLLNANNPTHELLLFDPETNTFRFVEDYVAYSGAIKLKGTNYYYSYHRSGCADSNWGSELIYIKNYKAYRIGVIDGIGCEGEKENGIFIYKATGDTKTLIKSIYRKPEYYADKIDFIADYWSKNYKRFK